MHTERVSPRTLVLLLVICSLECAQARETLVAAGASPGSELYPVTFGIPPESFPYPSFSARATSVAVYSSTERPTEYRIVMYFLVRPTPPDDHPAWSYRYAEVGWVPKSAMSLVGDFDPGISEDEWPDDRGIAPFASQRAKGSVSIQRSAGASQWTGTITFEGWSGAPGPLFARDRYFTSTVSVELVPSGNFFWIEPAGGFFNEDADWSSGTKPTASNDAYFDLPGAYTVALQSDESVASLNAVGGSIIFGLGSRSLNASQMSIANASVELAQGNLVMTNDIGVENGGELRLNGSYVAARNLFVFPQATVSGSGTIVGNVNSSGKFAPFAPTDALTISGKFTASATSQIEVGALLKVGDGSSQAVNLQGLITNAGGVLEINSADQAILGGTVQLNNGKIIARSGLGGARTQLNITGEIAAKGEISARVFTAAGSTVIATGALQLGDAASEDGVVVLGNLVVGSEEVTLSDGSGSNLFGRIELYGKTTIAGGALRSLQALIDLGSTGVLEGFGSIPDLKGHSGSELIVSGGIFGHKCRCTWRDRDVGKDTG